VNVARRYLIRHPRSPIARWARRILGIAATAAVLAVGVMIASMVLSVDGDDESVAPFPAAVPTVQATSAQKHKQRLRTHERRGEPGT
jgi:hypothetical protein